MTIVATRRRRRLNLIVASLCAVAIVVVVVVVVARCVFAIIVDFVARRAAAIVVVVAVSRCAIARRAVAVIVDFIARCAVAIVVIVVFARRNHHRRCRLSHRRPLRRHHRRCRRRQSPSSSSSYPVALCPSRRRHRHRRPSRRRHHRLRINTGTPHFSLGIPILVWGSPNQNRDHRIEMLMCVTNRFGDPRAEMGINTSPYQNGDPKIGLGIVQSLTRIGLGFVPIWDFRVLSPNWNGIQNGDPIWERGSPNRYG
jgi:hypothetical protein